MFLDLKKNIVPFFGSSFLSFFLFEYAYKQVVLYLYLETADEVVSGEQLVENEFKCVLATGLVQSKHVK